jgi:hypothetical protein
MHRFAPALRRVARQLDVPPSVRAGILLEMAGELEAVYHHHRNGGASDAEAARRAEEMVLGSPEVVRRLSDIHRRSWRAWSEGIGSRLFRGADLALLLAAVAPVVLVSTVVAARSAALHSGPLAVPLLVLALTITAVIALEAGRNLGGGRGGVAGLPSLLVLAALAPAFGLLAGTWTALSVSRTLAAKPVDMVGTEILLRVEAGSALLLVGLLLGMAAALTWFVLLNHAGARAAREVDAMLGTAGPIAEPDGIVIPLVRRRRG